LLLLRLRRRLAIVEQVTAPLQVRIAYERVAIERRSVDDPARLFDLRSNVQITDAIERIAQRYVGNEADRADEKPRDPAGAITDRRRPEQRDEKVGSLIEPPFAERQPEILVAAR